MNEKEKSEFDKLNDVLRVKSGSIDIKDKLTGFLYTLLRDHIQPSVAEKLVREEEIYGGDNKFSNGWLALYAHDLAMRLKEDTVK